MRSISTSTLILAAGSLFLAGCGSSTSMQSFEPKATTAQSSQQQMSQQKQQQPQITAEEAVAYANSTDYMYAYYPSQQVYFDPSRALFFWRERSGEWTQGKMLPGRFLLESDEAVTIPLDIDDPSKVHASIAAVYNSDASTATAGEQGDF